METRVLFDGGPGDVSAGDLSDMVWCGRRDGLVDVRVNITLEDGATVVTRVPAHARATREWEPCMGLLTIGIELDVDVLPDGDPEALLELGRITEDEYWDMVEP